MNKQNQELVNLKKYYENILALMPGHVFWKDKNGVMLGCNDLQAKDLGLSSRHDIIGKTDYDLFPKNEADILRANDLEVMQLNEEKLVEEPMKMKDGTIATYLSRKVPLKDANNEIIGIIGIALDITEIKRNLERLEHEKRQTEIALDNIIANLPEHVYWKNEDCVYLGCNEIQAKSLGLDSRREIIGKTDYDFSPPEIADEFRKNDFEVINQGISKSIEEVILKENGVNAVVLSKKVPLYDDNKNIVGLLGISFDITAEKEAEKLRLEKKVLEEREGTTRLLAASMAHELRTPLCALQLGTEGIEKYLPSLLAGYNMARDADMEVPYIPSSQYKGLGTVVENIQIEARAAFSVIDMLLVKTNLSRIEADSFTTCSFADIMKRALARYPFHKDQMNKIHWDKSDFPFYGDATLMEHVIFNLLKNALHYIKAANKGDIQIWCSQNSEHNIIHFKDTGQGIEPEILPRIFERFFTRTRHGTGVGLAFCKLVMQSFGGDIYCDSILNEYTEFTLLFPKAGER